LLGRHAGDRVEHAIGRSVDPLALVQLRLTKRHREAGSAHRDEASLGEGEGVVCREIDAAERRQQRPGHRDVVGADREGSIGRQRRSRRCARGANRDRRTVARQRRDGKCGVGVRIHPQRIDVETPVGDHGSGRRARCIGGRRALELDIARARQRHLGSALQGEIALQNHLLGGHGQMPLPPEGEGTTAGPPLVAELPSSTKGADSVAVTGALMLGELMIN